MGRGMGRTWGALGWGGGPGEVLALLLECLGFKYYKVGIPSKDILENVPNIANTCSASLVQAMLEPYYRWDTNCCRSANDSWQPTYARAANIVNTGEAKSLLAVVGNF